MLDIKNILAEGRRIKTALSKAEREKEPQALRAGNSGILIQTPDEDIVYGECARKAHLRYLQIEDTADAVTNEKFDEGTSSELIVNDIITPGLDVLYPGYKLKAGNDTVNTSWNVSSGIPVTGRPDGVIVNSSGEPVAIIEHKKKISFYSMRNASFDGIPDNKHIIQAAHYSWQLGCIPAYIIYRNGTIWHYYTFDRRIKDDIESSPYKNGITYKGETPFTVEPHYSIFTLTWEDDVVMVEYEGKKQATLVTVEGIQSFYEASDSIKDTKELGPRPTSKSVIVGNKASYKPCQYCFLKNVCDEHENNYDAWLDHVKSECEQSAQWLKKGLDNGVSKEESKQRVFKKRGK